MKRIPITKGMVVLVDDEDYEHLVCMRWCYCNGYAGKQINKKFVYMHRLILGVTDSEYVVDHINGNTLDNRRSNLRIASAAENARNQRVRRVSKTSKYKGVSWDVKRRKWNAFIKVGYQSKYIGAYPDEYAAAHAYDCAARELHGQYANLNFPDEV